MDKAAVGRSRTRSICLVGLAVALIAVSAWVTIPIGPIPFTLQMLAIPLMIYVLRPSEVICAIYAYVFLGGLGLPIFSGMRGGIGVLLGPTGGFLIGYLIGVPLAALLLHAVRSHMAKRSPQNGSASPEKGERAKVYAFLRSSGWELLAGIIFIFFAYLVGTLRYNVVTGVGLPLSFAACAAPFIVPDLIKDVLAILAARLIKSALRERYW